jgi:glycosyltransferase involved in cell wall biosynthesis
MTPALGPWLWRLTGGAPYVLHVQDLWPDSLVGSSLLPEKFGERSLLAILNVWLSNVYKHAAALIAIAPRMVQTLVARGVDSHKVHLVYNWAERPTLSPGSSIERSRSGEGTKILYAGNVGDMQDLGTAIEAAFRARDAGVCLPIVGDGVALPRMRKLVNELGADNITFRDPVPSSKMGSFYESADYALVSLKDLATFRGAIPSKFQAALAYGVPIISTVQGDTRDLVEYYNVGLTTDAEDVFGLERAFREAAGWPNEKWMSAHRNPIEAFTSDFSPSIGISKIESILAEIAFPVRENASRETDKKRSRE